MKRNKKLISLILTLMIMLSITPIKTLACIDLPEITKIELADNVIPVSYQEVEKFYYDGETEMYLDDMRYNLHFSDGTVIENTEGISFKNGVYFAYPIAKIIISEAMKAYTESKQKINVYIETQIAYTYGKFDIINSTDSNRLVNQIIENINLIDPLPEYEDDQPNKGELFVGKNFEINYVDGTKKIAKVESDEGNLSLDGYYFDVRDYDMSYIDKSNGNRIYYSGITIYYLDAMLILNEKQHSCQYSSFEVLDYNYNANGRLESLTYRLTYKNGNVIEKKCTITSNNGAYDFIMIDAIDGYDIVAQTWVTDGGLIQNDYASLSIDFGHRHWGLSYFEEIEYDKICDCKCHKGGIYHIVNYFLRIISAGFLMTDNLCKCGFNH